MAFHSLGIRLLLLVDREVHSRCRIARIQSRESRVDMEASFNIMGKSLYDFRDNDMIVIREILSNQGSCLV